MASKEGESEDTVTKEEGVTKNSETEVIEKMETNDTDKNTNNSSNETTEPSVEVNTHPTENVTDTGGGEGTKDDAQKENCDSGETVSFKVIYNKQKYDVTFPFDKKVAQLKDHIQSLTGVPSKMQKIMFKGLAKDESTLRDLKVTNSAKIMVVGSTMNDVLQVTKTPTQKELLEEEKASSSKEPLSQQKQHKKVLDKHKKPDDVMPGIKNDKQSLPPVPLTGMYNKSGGKVRLTFKLELDQVWLSTKERTEKIPMNSIKAVVSEPLVGNEEYHMLALQLGPTEASRYWIYWVPAQYVDAIKDTVLGKWQFF